MKEQERAGNLSTPQPLVPVFQQGPPWECILEREGLKAVRETQGAREIALGMSEWCQPCKKPLFWLRLHSLRSAQAADEKRLF